jgi:hypothetical protein
MSDPASYIGAKLASMIGGFIGGSMILTFIRPKTIGEAFTRGGVSVGSAMIFSAPLIHFMEWSNNWENQMMAGFCIGFAAYSVLGMVANFFIKNKDNDIVDVVSDIKDVVITTKPDKSDKSNSERS